ncbi:unnamed protein product [Amoebophrya sp. A120]|nr:unnamed protein product [Amoebophrya sp. A120]|eukprot:GSA120T00006975001.1
MTMTKEVTDEEHETETSWHHREDKLTLLEVFVVKDDDEAVDEEELIGELQRAQNEDSETESTTPLLTGYYNSRLSTPKLLSEKDGTSTSEDHPEVINLNSTTTSSSTTAPDEADQSLGACTAETRSPSRLCEDPARARAADDDKPPASSSLYSSCCLRRFFSCFQANRTSPPSRQSNPQRSALRSGNFIPEQKESTHSERGGNHLRLTRSTSSTIKSRLVLAKHRSCSCSWRGVSTCLLLVVTTAVAILCSLAFVLLGGAGVVSYLVGCCAGQQDCVEQDMWCGGGFSDTMSHLAQHLFQLHDSTGLELATTNNAVAVATPGADGVDRAASTSACADGHDCAGHDNMSSPTIASRAWRAQGDVMYKYDYGRAQDESDPQQAFLQHRKHPRKPRMGRPAVLRHGAYHDARTHVGLGLAPGPASRSTKNKRQDDEFLDEVEGGPPHKFGEISRERQHQGASGLVELEDHPDRTSRSELLHQNQGDSRDLQRGLGAAAEVHQPPAVAQSSVMQKQKLRFFEVIIVLPFQFVGVFLEAGGAAAEAGVQIAAAAVEAGAEGAAHGLSDMVQGFGSSIGDAGLHEHAHGFGDSFLPADGGPSAGTAGGDGATDIWTMQGISNLSGADRLLPDMMGPSPPVHLPGDVGEQVERARQVRDQAEQLAIVAGLGVVGVGVGAAVASQVHPLLHDGLGTTAARDDRSMVAQFGKYREAVEGIGSITLGRGRGNDLEVRMGEQNEGPNLQSLFPEAFSFLLQEDTERIFVWASVVRDGASDAQLEEEKEHSTIGSGLKKDPEGVGQIFREVEEEITRQVQEHATRPQDVGKKADFLTAVLQKHRTGQRFVAEVLGDWVGPGGSNCNNGAASTSSCPVHLPPPGPQVLALLRVVKAVFAKLLKGQTKGLIEVGRQTLHQVGLGSAPQVSPEDAKVQARMFLLLHHYVLQPLMWTKDKRGNKPGVDVFGGPGATSPRKVSQLTYAALKQFKIEVQKEKEHNVSASDLCEKQVQNFLRIVSVDTPSRLTPPPPATPARSPVLAHPRRCIFTSVATWGARCSTGSGRGRNYGSRARRCGH